jgi:hypothetical protein
MTSQKTPFFTFVYAFIMFNFISLSLFACKKVKISIKLVAYLEGLWEKPCASNINP